MELAVMLHATPLRGCRLRLQIAFAIAPTEIPAASRRRTTALPAGREQAAGACTLDEALTHWCNPATSQDGVFCYATAPASAARAAKCLDGTICSPPKKMSSSKTKVELQDLLLPL